jgi:hypothetical protein
VTPFEGDVTVNYGKQAVGNFGWGFDTFQGYSNEEASGSLGRYAPTLFFDNVEGDESPGAVVAMLEDRDWAFHMEFRHRGPYDPADNDFVLFAKHAPADAGGTPDGREDRIFALNRGNNANDWSILAGNSAGGWSTVVGSLPHPMDPELETPELYVDFDVHFKATEQEMDFYWESQLVGTASTGHGRYDLDFLQFEHKPNWEGIQEFRNFRLGHNLGDAPPGDVDADYNGDGIVDAGDYPVWRKFENTAGFPGTVIGDGDDGTGTGTPDGIVDDSDYDFWVSRFGATTPLGSGGGGSAAVPEPTAAVLLIFMTMMWAPAIRSR